MDPTTALGYSWSDSSNKIRHRSRIPSDQHPELTMSINVSGSESLGFVMTILTEPPLSYRYLVLLRAVYPLGELHCHRIRNRYDHRVYNCRYLQCTHIMLSISLRWMTRVCRQLLGHAQQIRFPSVLTKSTRRGTEIHGAPEAGGLYY